MEMIDLLLSSDKSNRLKSSLSYKYIMRAVHEPMTRLECSKVILKLSDWVCLSEHSFLRDNALAGLDELAEMNVMVFLEILDKSYFDNIFNKQHIHPVSIISLTMKIFSQVSKCERSNTFTFPHYLLIRHSLVLYLAHHGHDPRLVDSLLSLYTMHPVLIPQDTQDIDLLGNVVIHLHTSHPSSCQCDGKLVRLLSHVWRTCQNITPCMVTLNTLYEVLSDPDIIISPPACLALILESLPSTFQEQGLVYLLDQYLPSQKTLLLLSRVLAWLEVREVPILTSSLRIFLPLLGELRGNLVLNLCRACLTRIVDQVIKVDSIPCKKQLVTVLLTLLYGDQQLVLFHSVLSRLPIVTQSLEVDGLHLYREQVLEMVMHFQGLFPDIMEGTAMQRILQDEHLVEISPERRLELAGWAWRNPGFIKMDRKSGRLVGLTNLGNTCYLNSVLQALFCTKMFQTMLADSTPNKTQPIMNRLKILFRCLCLSRKSSADPRAFLEVSRPPWFDVGYQQDCSEFLTFLLHSLKEEEDRIFMDEEGNNVQYKDGIREDGPLGDKSSTPTPDMSVESSGGDTCPIPSTIVQSVFGGELDTSYQCMECENISRGATSFTDLHLPIPTSIATPRLPHLPNISITRARAKLSVQDLIKSYLEPEHLISDNQYHCNTCVGLRNAVKTIQIKAAPRHLVITLLRFKYNASNRRKVKLLRNIDCPRIIDLPVGDGQVRYHLYCVVVHFGQTSEGGHYYTLVRDKEEWYKVSDEEVETMSVNWDQEEKRRWDTPYIIFYQREDVI